MMSQVESRSFADITVDSPADPAILNNRPADAGGRDEEPAIDELGQDGRPTRTWRLLLSLDR